MFATDSFLSAEVTYRADRIRRGWGNHRPSAKSRQAPRPSRSTSQTSSASSLPVHAPKPQRSPGDRVCCRTGTMAVND